MSFSEQKWVRLGASFFIKDFLFTVTGDKWAQIRNKYKKWLVLFIHCWFKRGNMNASGECERGVILGQIFFTRGKKIFSAPMP